MRGFGEGSKAGMPAQPSNFRSTNRSSSAHAIAFLAVILAEIEANIKEFLSFHILHSIK